MWDGVPVQRCTVHKHRNLLAHAPERLHEEVTADCNDMIYAATREEVESRRKAFIRTWRLKCRAVADSLEEAGDRLFTFTGCRQPVAQHPDHQRDRAAARRVQAPDQDADRAAISRHAARLLACSLTVRSTCERSMVGGRSPQTPSVSRLTSPPEKIPSMPRGDCATQIPTAFRTAPDLRRRPGAAVLQPNSRYSCRSVCKSDLFLSRRRWRVRIRPLSAEFSLRGTR